MQSNRNCAANPRKFLFAALLFASVATAQSPYWVYYGGQFQWTDASYSGAAKYKDTSGRPESGSYDIEFKAEKWGAWQGAAPNLNFNLAPYTSVTFALKPTVANQQWSCYFQTASGATGVNLNIKSYGPTPVVGEWGVYTIPLSALGFSGGSIARFAIQDQTGRSRNTWYIDNIGFQPTAVPAPTVTLTANPTSITAGTSVTLSWSSSNATSCTASGGWSGTEATSGSASVTPTSTTTYTLTCTGAGGTSSPANATVTVTAAPPPPTVALSANPSSIVAGTSATLSWSSTNATSCTAGGGWSGTEATSGTASVSPTSTTTYTLTCTGAGGTTSPSSATVTVTAALPTVTLAANPTSIASGSSSTLTWSSTNATACTASGSWSGAEATSGSTSVSPTSNASYTLSCTGAGGSAQASATVTVTGGGGSNTAYWIYYNGQYNWPGDYSFAATPNYTSTAGAPLSGKYDIQISDQTWGGWQPYAPGSSFDVSPYKYLTISLQPTVANQTWTCYFTKAGSTTANPAVNVLNYGPAPVVGQWGVYTIPLADLGVSGSSVAEFVIQDQTGLATNTWYIDNVAFAPSNVISFPPTVTLTANPILFTGSGTSTLTWSSSNATACTASGGWSGWLATSGAQQVAASTNSYILNCTGAGGSATASASTTLTNPSAFSIQVSGNTFVNGQGKPVQLRGVNLSGMEFTAIGGWDPSDPTGGGFGQPNNPNWSAITAWKANIVRIPLNEDSWLGLTCTDTSGVVHNADPGGNYKQFLANLVQEANAAGIYVILDLHWAAPGNSCPMLQSQMADSDHSLAFWTSIANTYKNNPAVLFELFNEPFLDFDFSGDPWQYLMFGTGGSFSGYPASSNSGNWQNVQTPWNIASYQAMIGAIRATGATNVVLIGSLSYTADLSGWLSHKPTDPIGQIAATWHPYPTYGATWGTPAWAQPNYSPEIFTEVQSILASGVPVIATETGDQDTAGTVGAPLVQTITTFADANGVSVLGWTWDVWQNPDFVLIKDVNGTPTDGYGQFFQSWMVNHP